VESFFGCFVQLPALDLLAQGLGPGATGQLLI